MSEPYQLTEHAIEQFRRRWRPDYSDKDLRDELMALLQSSKPFDKTTAGDQIRISGHQPDIRMVVKDRVVCVTVLPKLRRRTSNLPTPEEMMEFAEEKMETKASSSESDPAKEDWGPVFQETWEDDVRQEIEQLEKEMAVLDQQRRELGLKKSELHNRVQSLKIKLTYKIRA